MRTPPSFFREQIPPFWAIHRGKIPPIWLAQRRASPHLLPWVWIAPFPGKMPGFHGHLHWPRSLHKCEAAAFASRVNDVSTHTPQQVIARDGARVRPDGRTLPLMTSSMTPGCWELPHALRLDCWRASPRCSAVEMPANGPTTGEHQGAGPSHGHHPKRALHISHAGLAFEEAGALASIEPRCLGFELCLPARCFPSRTGLMYGRCAYHVVARKGVEQLKQASLAQRRACSK